MPVKRKIHVKVNVDQVADRLAELVGIESTGKSVAKELDLSPSNYSNYKKRGTLIHVFVDWAIQHGVSVDWLLTGQAHTEEQADLKTNRLLDQTKAILESKNKPLADTLAKSIETFYEAIKPAEEQPDAKISAGEAFDIVAKELVFICSNPDCGKEVGSMTAPEELSDVCPFCGEVTNAKTYAEQIAALGIGLKESDDPKKVRRKAGS